MFGIFYLLANIIGGAISGAKRISDNAYYKGLGWKNYRNGNDHGAHIYYDALGRERDLTTNHLMFSYRKNGDLYIEDLKTFKVRNLSEEEIDQKIELAKEFGINVRAIYYKNWTFDNSGLRGISCGIPGRVYKDVNNGQLYFERYITWDKNDFSKPGEGVNRCSAYFYLRITDGKIVSISDKQEEKDKENDKHNNYEEFIEFFNSEQEKGGFVVRNRNKYAKGKDDYYIASEKICNNW